MEETAPVGSEVLVITSCWMMVMLRALVTFCCGVPESAACTVNEEAPAVVGAPVIAPVAELSERPAGSVTTVTDQVTAPEPQVEAKVALYGVLVTPLDREVVVMDKTGTMVRLRALVAVS